MTTKRNVLFVGTGGGNDVFSTTLAMDALWRSGWRWQECAIAGVLSPFHAHSSQGSVWFPGATITMPGDTRSLIRKRDARQIGFVDEAVSRMVAEERPHGCTLVYGLSLRNGTKGLTESFRTLAKRYDYIVLVDLGGDIFYGGAEDRHVLSPMFDSMVLRAFVDSGVAGCLIEAGPGTDGELEPGRLLDALVAAQASSHWIDPASIAWWNGLYRKWIEPVRPGRTVPLTIQAYGEEDQETLTVPFRARAHVGSLKKYAYFDQTISVDLCARFYFVEPHRIVNPFAVTCNDPYDWFVKTQVAQQRTNCEANLEYLRGADGRITQLVTPSPLFSPDDRVELITFALHDILAGAADAAWIFPEDLALVPSGAIEAFAESFDAGGLVHLSKIS